MEKEYREFTKTETKWLNSFKRVMEKAPSTLFMFVGGDVLIGTKDENNERYIDGGSMDSNANWESVPTDMEVDGGDW